MQALIDLGVVDVESPSIEGEDQTFDQLITRVQTSLDILESATQESFLGKESMTVNVHLGTFSLDRDALRYLHEISLPSL